MLHEQVEAKLKAVARRSDVQARWRSAITAALLGTVVAGIALLLRAVWPFSYVIVAAAAGVASAITYVYIRPTPTSLFQAAQAVDRMLHLDERLATAVEWHPTMPEHTHIAVKLHADAARFSPTITPHLLVPYRLPRRSLLLMPLLLIVAFLIVMNPVVHLSGSDSLASDDVGSSPSLSPDDWQSIADQLKDTAALRNDDALEQLAHMLDDLIARWRSGDVTAAQLERELAALENRLNAMLDTGPPAGEAPDWANAAGGEPGSDPTVNDGPGDVRSAEAPGSDDGTPGQGGDGNGDIAEDSPLGGDREGRDGPGASDAAAHGHDDGIGRQPREDQDGTADDRVGETEYGNDPVHDTGPPAPPGGSAAADSTDSSGLPQETHSDEPGETQQQLAPSTPDDDSATGNDPGSDTGSEPSPADSTAADMPRPDTTGTREHTPGIVSATDVARHTLDTTSAPVASGGSGAHETPQPPLQAGDESDVEHEAIPLAYRHWVRLYFQQTGTP